MEIADAGGAGIVGVVGKHIEEKAPYNGLAGGHRRSEVRVVNPNDGEIGRQEEIAARGGVEDRLVIDARCRVRHGRAGAGIWAGQPGNGGLRR